MANDTSAFVSVQEHAPLSASIIVPPGSYNLGGVDLPAAGRRIIYVGDVTFPNGQLTGHTVERIDPTSGGGISAYYDSLAVNWMQRAPYRLGGQYASAALSIGSGDPSQSKIGTALFADGHSNFLAFQPEEQYNPIEINLYTAAATGRANTVPGTNRIQARTDIYYNPFSAVMVGKCLYYAGIKYRVSSFISATELALELWDGTPVTFVAAQDTYHFTYSIYRGTCNVNGTAVTRTGGHIFPGYGVNETSVLEINGSVCTLSGSIAIDNIAINENLGTLTDVNWVWYCEIDGETTALRMNHSNVGEQFNITTSACPEDDSGAGYYMSSLAGYGTYRPIVIRNLNKDGITIAPNYAADKAYVGIGTFRRIPACELDVNGEVRNSLLSLKDQNISEFATNGAADTRINLTGYAGGITQFRSLNIYDGKGTLITTFDGPTNNVAIGATVDPSYKLRIGGNLGPNTDNAFVCGGSGARWAAVWAATGTIQTSHGPDKIIDQPLSQQLRSVAGAFIDNVDPVIFKWKVGGLQEIDSETEFEEIEVPELEEIQVEKVNIEVKDGKAVRVVTQEKEYRPIIDLMPVFDETGNPVMETVPASIDSHGNLLYPAFERQMVHAVERKRIERRPKKTGVEVAGKRNHAGFIAQDFKAEMDRVGLDFGVWGLEDANDLNGRQWLRPDQQIPILWAALRETREEVKRLRALIGQ